jgi:hypothetical protein
LASFDFSTPLKVTVTYENCEDALSESEHDNFYECATPKLYNEYKTEENQYSKEYQNDESPPLINLDIENQYKMKCSCQRNHSENYIDVEPMKKRKCTQEANVNHAPNKSVFAVEIFVADRNKDIEKVIDKNRNTENAIDDTNKTQQTDKANTIKDFNDLNGYLNDLLFKVSESLIYVLEAYHLHLGNFIRYNDVKFVQESKKRYLHVRNHFFQLSYCTATTIILSRENDTKFIDDFLYNTVVVAKEKKQLLLTAQQIKPFFYDMISWVKQKKDLRNVPISNAPLLRRQLALPPKSMTAINPQSVASSNITVLNNMIREKTFQKNFNQPVRLHNIVSPNQAQIPSQTLLNHQQTRPNVDRLLSQSNVGAARNYNNRNNFSCSELHGTASTMFNRHRFDDSNRLPSNEAPLNQERYVDNCNPMNMRFLTSYEPLRQWNPQSSITENQEFNRNSDQFHIHSQDNIETLRSSVSTDSGFISPHQSGSPTYNMVRCNQTFYIGKWIF